MRCPFCEVDAYARDRIVTDTGDFAPGVVIEQQWECAAGCGCGARWATRQDVRIVERPVKVVGASGILVSFKGDRATVEIDGTWHSVDAGRVQLYDSMIRHFCRVRDNEIVDVTHYEYQMGRPGKGQMVPPHPPVPGLTVQETASVLKTLSVEDHPASPYERIMGALARLLDVDTHED